MKRIGILILFLALLNDSMAQAPELFSFQSVIRGADEKLLANRDVTLRFSINQYDSLGATVFSEHHYLKTNSNGLMTARIGEGQLISGDISNIEWENGPYFAQYEVDYDGQEGWDISAYTQMMSVPYSLYAKYLEGGADQDTTNEIQFITISNDTLILSDGGFVSLTSYLDNTDDQVLSISNDTISLEDGGSVVLPALPPEVDLDSTNEIQTVSISNDTLFISGSNSVSLNSYLDNTDDQVLTLSGDTLFLEDGGSVVLPYDIDSLFTDELQQLQISGLGDIKDLTITDGNTIQFSIADNDNDSINEIQGLAEVLSVDSNAAGMNIVNVNSLTIGADTVDSNIALNVQSTTAGAIFSAMTKIQRLAIGSPNEGLIVTQIDEKKGLYMFINGSWVRFKTSGVSGYPNTTLIYTTNGF